MVKQLSSKAFTFSCFLVLGFASPTWAAKIAKVSGKKVMVTLEGDSAKAGDIFVLYDSAGKKKGLIKISAVKGDKAIGSLGRGKAEKGWTAKIAEKKGKKKSSQASTGRTSSEGRSGSTGKTMWGVMAGLSSTSMKVKIDNDNDGTRETTVALSGMAFSVKGVYDYNLFSNIWFRGLLGIEGLSAKGESQVGCGNAACDANIYYLSGDFWGRYVLPMETFKPWIGAAFTLMFPASKKASALEESSITNTSAISVGLGADWKMSETMTIPIQVGYSLLPNSDTVTAAMISIRAGFLMPF